MNKFFEELKRRNVIKSALAYLVVAWVLLQVFEILLPMVNAPEWSLKGLTLLMAIGLPIWIVISWIYDISPEGIEKTSKDSDNELKTELTNKRLNVFIIASLSIAVVVLTLNLSFFSSDSDKRFAIAVLPFERINTNDEDDWFSTGLAIDIRTYLSKIKNLTVISESAVNEALDSKKPISEIAELLGVSHFVGGSVTQIKNNIKITVHLTDSRSHKDVWSDNYVRSFDDPFVIQSDVSQHVVEGLEITLTTEEEKTLEKYPTENMEAYNLFSKGRLINDSRKKEDLESNIKYNEEAIALDPNFAEAYAEIGQSTFLLRNYYNYGEGIKKAIPYLEKALQLDANNAMAYGVKGAMTSNKGNWKEAKEYFEKAIALDPNSATIRYQYAIHAEQKEAVIFNSQITIGQKLDPLSPLVGHMFFLNLIRKEKIEEAEKYYNKYSFLFKKAGEQLEKKSILIAYKNKDWTAAIRFYEKEIEKNPNNAILNRKLGEAYDGILIDEINYLKYTKKAYELDSTNLDNGVEYHNALLRNNDFSEAKKLMQGENFKTLFDPKENLNILFYYYYYQENYKKAQEVFKKGSLINDNFQKALIFAQLGDRESIDSLIVNNLIGKYSKAYSYAILKEKDSMYYYLERISLFDASRTPVRSYRWWGFRNVNSWKEFDPYRKEERYKVILKKNYLPITHWNE